MVSLVIRDILRNSSAQKYLSARFGAEYSATEAPLFYKAWPDIESAGLWVDVKKKDHAPNQAYWTS